MNELLMLKRITKKNILNVCIASTFLLMIFTAGLGVAGVLETTEQGDIEYISTEQFKDGSSVTVPTDGRQFAIETPTDADAFYNAVIRADNGGPLINRGIIKTEGIQAFHYHPITYHFYAVISVFGYIGFKILLLILSIIAVMSGTSLLLFAERDCLDIKINKNTLIILSLASTGVGPVLSNLKTGQTTPFLFFLVSLFWWGYRQNRLRISGVALATATFFKPYAIAPIALGFKKDKMSLLIHTTITYMMGTFFAIAFFGMDEITKYFSIIIEELSEETMHGTYQISTASNLGLLYWTGEASQYLRIVLFIPLAYLGIKYLTSDSFTHALHLFSATLLSIFILLSDPSGLDLPLLLPAFILIGLHTYCKTDYFWAIGLTFMLLHIHPIVLEVLVGNGSKYVPLISSNQTVIQTYIPILQPGMYSILGLYFIIVASSTMFTKHKSGS